MTVLLRKEIRSLFPAWVMSIAAAALIAFVRPNAAPTLLFVAGMGCVLLGITSFGSEFSQGTFSLLLAQPIPRNRIWRLKTITLGAALLSIAVMAFFAFFSRFLLSGMLVQAEDVEMLVDFLLFAVLLLGAAFAGGLLSALATRQMATAFWIALLFPFAACGITAIVTWFVTAGRSDKIMQISVAAALAVYDVLAFLLARRQFLLAQDLPGAAGTSISIPTWFRFRTKARFITTAPSYRPVRALIAKELQLHQVSLCFAAFLLAINVIAVLVRRMILHPGNSQTLLYEILAGCSLMWFFLPVIIAGPAVAEERRQGTLESSLCLPARKSMQWFIKCAVCFILSVFFAGVMPWLLEGAAQLIGCPWIYQGGSSLFADQWHFVLWSVTVTAIMTLVSFYASSLARSLLQAVGVAAVVGSVFIWLAFQVAAVDSDYGLGARSLNDFLSYGLTALWGLLLWLSCYNFKHLTVGWRLWLENASALLVVVFLVGGSALLFAQPSHPRSALPIPPGVLRHLRQQTPPLLPPKGFFHAH